MVNWNQGRGVRFILDCSGRSNGVSSSVWTAVMLVGGCKSAWPGDLYTAPLFALVSGRHSGRSRRMTRRQKLVHSGLLGPSAELELLVARHFGRGRETSATSFTASLVNKRSDGQAFFRTYVRFRTALTLLHWTWKPCDSNIPTRLSAGLTNF